MAVTIRPLHPVFVGEVSGVDLREPLTADDVESIDAGMAQYGVLVFHGKNISDEQQADFSRNFGKLELPGNTSHIAKEEDRRLGPEMADLSNLDKQNRLLARGDRYRMFNLANRLWHSDSSFKAIPAKYSLLSGRVVTTEGGETQFADMRAAYDTLDPKTQGEIENLICEHSMIYSRGALGFDDLSETEKQTFKPVRQSLVRTHPVSGRKSIYLSSHIGQIIGWPRPEAMCLIRDLTEHATQREFVYTHVWQQYDLVIWDNQQTMHRARPFDDVGEVRDVRRTTVAGDGPTAEQVAA